MTSGIERNKASTLRLNISKTKQGKTKTKMCSYRAKRALF